MPAPPKTNTGNFILALLAALACFGAGSAPSQEKAAILNLAAINDAKAWNNRHIDARFLSVDGRQAVHLQSLADSANGIVGLALPVGVEFDTGVIELDLKGKNVRGRSFLGVAFNVVDETNFEAVYFRPFNFKADEPFRGRAVQYISWPSNTWEHLRKEHTGQFENAITPVPDPDGWFHARIEVTGKQVRVFVNDAKDPTLVVKRLAASNARRPTGLFVDSADGYFADVRVIRGEN